jgi:hypothetical protein
MPGGERRTLLAVALMSGAAFGYELLLLRFFAIMYWNHFTHLIISMALLGFGVSGTVLALTQHRLLPCFHRSFFLSALLFACLLPVVTSLAGRLGFNPPEVIWKGDQLARLAAVFVLVTIPFSCAGLCIGLTMRWQTGLVARIYRADLCGAACGALLIMALLFVLPPQDGVRVLALTGLAAAVLMRDTRTTRTEWIGLAAIAFVIGLWPGQWLAPAMSPYKGMSQTLHVPGVEVVEEKQSPAGAFAALTSAAIPFRFAPGLSLLAPASPPHQVALFHDGHSAGVILRGSDEPAAFEFLGWTPMALPYVLVDRPRVLVAGAGGGGDIWHALIEGAVQVDAVEPHRELTGFVDSLSSFSGALLTHEKVRLHSSDVRGFLAAATASYNLIQISPLGSAAPPSAGGHALEASYLYTVESLHLALSRLAPHGLLAITLPLELPPRSAVKMTATIAAALKQLGHGIEPARHVVIVRTWNTVTIAASRSPLSAPQLSAARDFCRTRAFDLDWLPDITAAEVNRINVLDRPYLYEAAIEIWQGQPYRQLQGFNLLPATDDRPWFNHFFRWASFVPLWTQRASGTASLLEWEYLLLWMSLAVALVVSLLAIVWPLRLFSRSPRRNGHALEGNLARGLYFAALGLAFLFLEIACIQQWILFLRHPLLAMAVIVPSFLFFAGFGSGWAHRLAAHTESFRLTWLRDRPVAVVATAIGLVAALYLWLLPLIFAGGAAWPVPLRILVSILLIGGLAFWMGMPFPLGLMRLGQNRPDFVPLAWGVNGLFSVISAIVATILALHAGFRMVVLAAIVLYLLAAVLERRL